MVFYIPLPLRDLLPFALLQRGGKIANNQAYGNVDSRISDMKISRRVKLGFRKEGCIKEAPSIWGPWGGGSQFLIFGFLCDGWFRANRWHRSEIDCVCVIMSPIQSKAKGSHGNCIPLGI